MDAIWRRHPLSRLDMSRVRSSALVGTTLAVLILSVFAALLLATAADRSAVRRDLVRGLGVQLTRQGVQLSSTSERPVRCHPELTYRLVCTVVLAGDAGTVRFGLDYLDTGCWHGDLLRAPPMAQALPRQ